MATILINLKWSFFLLGVSATLRVAVGLYRVPRLTRSNVLHQPLGLALLDRRVCCKTSSSAPFQSLTRQKKRWPELSKLLALKTLPPLHFLAVNFFYSTSPGPSTSTISALFVLTFPRLYSIPVIVAKGQSQSFLKPTTLA